MQNHGHRWGQVGAVHSWVVLHRGSRWDCSRRHGAFSRPSCCCAKAAAATATRGGRATTRATIGGGGSGDQGCGRLDLRLIREVQFLDEELIVSIREAEVGGSDDVSGVGVGLVHPAEQVQNKDRLVDGLADITQLVSGGLHKEAVVDGVTSLVMEWNS